MKTFKFCDKCTVTEPDVILALDEMTTDSLVFIVQQVDIILKQREEIVHDSKLG